MLSIIIVNYNSLVLIQDCLDSLYQFHPNFDGEIIIVNNANDVTEADAFKQINSTVLWSEMGYNAGFARANNHGIRQAKGDCILLLNPDIIFIAPILDTCATQLLQSANTIAAGVQLLNRDKSFQISGSYFVKGGLNHLLPLPYWGNFIRKIALGLNSKTPHLKESNAIEKVDWINGAYLMVKKSVLDQTGLLDEDFFMYGEEVEWCSRLKKAGELVIYGDLKLIHLVGQSSEKSAEKEYYDLYSKKGLQMMVGNHLRIRKQFGVFWLFVLYLNYLFSAIIALPIALVTNLFGNKKVTASNATKFLRNMIKVTTLLPKIILNRPHFYKLM